MLHIRYYLQIDATSRFHKVGPPSSFGPGCCRRWFSLVYTRSMRVVRLHHGNSEQSNLLCQPRKKSREDDSCSSVAVCSHAQEHFGGGLDAISPRLVGLVQLPALRPNDRTPAQPRGSFYGIIDCQSMMGTTICVCVCARVWGSSGLRRCLRNRVRPHRDQESYSNFDHDPVASQSFMSLHVAASQSSNNGLNWVG